MYYRLINWLDGEPHCTAYNCTSVNELVEWIYDLLTDEYFEYDLDFIEDYEHKFATDESKINRIKENLKSWSVWRLNIEKRKYPFKYKDLINWYWDDYYFKDLDKQMWNRFKK